MADPVTFSRKRHRPTRVYQLQRFGSDGGVRATLRILACDDAEARWQARELTDGLRSELRFGGQLLEHLAPGDHPIAASIELFGDPAAMPDL